MTLSFGVSVPTSGAFADPFLLGHLAEEAERAGWDGFFIWDELISDGLPVGDVTVSLAVIALQTTRLRFGPMVTPLPRRRPTKVAREMVALDRMSGGRLIFGAGIGSDDASFRSLGEVADPRIRGDMLDEGLDLLTHLWTGQPVDHAQAEHHYRVQISVQTDSGERVGFLPTPLQQPRIPIWIAATGQHRRPLRRAATWDGLFYIPDDERAITSGPTAAELKAAVDYARQFRPSDEPWQVATSGITSGTFPSEDAERIAEFAEATGLTWWIEQINPWAIPGHDLTDNSSVNAMFERVRSGPPRLLSAAP
jgi:alkanesulfonate monooxygenase SsuD/methylene tetrahydromethanopterin reductase-like flavin-dependent oxidoreductase (luciferase family)